MLSSGSGLAVVGNSCCRTRDHDANVVEVGLVLEDRVIMGVWVTLDERLHVVSTSRGSVASSELACYCGTVLARRHQTAAVSADIDVVSSRIWILGTVGRVASWASGCSEAHETTV